MKTIFFWILAGWLATALPAHASNDDCLANDFDSGVVLYSAISKDIRYSKHCLMPEHDGDLSIVVVGADTPIEVEASHGGMALADTVIWKRGKRYPVSREIRFPMHSGQRIDVRVDPLVPSRERHGAYRLLAITTDSDDPNRFAALALMKDDGVTIKYEDARELMNVITIDPDQTRKFFLPYLGRHPVLRLGVDGVDPTQLMIGTIELSTGKVRMAELREGYFDVPMLDPKGMVLSIASKSEKPVSFKIKD